jgi:hypothetical protein
MKHLTGYLGIDLSKAGWESYTIRGDKDGGSVLVLFEVEFPPDFQFQFASHASYLSQHCFA